MESIVGKLRPKQMLLSRVWLIALMVWFAVPEAKAYSATVKPQLHSQLVKPGLLQAGFVKLNQANTVVKQLVIIPNVSVFSVRRPVPKLQEAHIAQSASYYNSFYVYTTIKAP